MNKNKSEKVTVTYKSPKCDITEIGSEGVLCASLQQLNEDPDYVYEW